jgi:hypothetical protein
MQRWGLMRARQKNKPVIAIAIADNLVLMFIG